MPGRACLSAGSGDAGPNPVDNNVPHATALAWFGRGKGAASWRVWFGSSATLDVAYCHVWRELGVRARAARGQHC